MVSPVSDPNRQQLATGGGGGGETEGGSDGGGAGRVERGGNAGLENCQRGGEPRERSGENCRDNDSGDTSAIGSCKQTVSSHTHLEYVHLTLVRPFYIFVEPDMVDCPFVAACGKYLAPSVAAQMQVTIP